MEPWVDVALQRLRERKMLPVDGATHVLGVVPAAGHSKIVSVAYPSHASLFHRVMAMSLILVAPAPHRQHAVPGQEWFAYESTVVAGTHSPRKTIVLSYGVFCGVWLLAGMASTRTIASVTVQTSDGSPLVQDVHGNGFLLMMDKDHSPMRIEIMGANGVTLEAFTYPLATLDNEQH